MTSLAEELQAASDANVARWAAEREAKELPEEVEVSAAGLRRALSGGRAQCTVRSRKTGRHVKVRLTVKKRNADGRGYVSRAKIEGRVGVEDGDVIFADDPDQDWSAGSLGSFDLRTGEWRTRAGAEKNRAWAAERLIRWAFGSFRLEEKAEVMLATFCCVCGHRLEDPESIRLGIGPDCNRRRTGSRVAERR